jgi:hypothetical protein
MCVWQANDATPITKHKRGNKMTITAATIKMIAPWLTGNDEADAKMLKQMFRGARLAIGEWR